MDFRRLFDLFYYQRVYYPQEAALARRLEMGWKSYSTDDCIAAVNRISAGFLSRGTERGDKIAILSGQGDPRWHFLDVGLQQSGAVVVHVQSAAPAAVLETILQETKARFCISGDRHLYDTVAGISDRLLHLEGHFMLDEASGISGWRAMIQEPSDQHLETIQGLRAAIHEDDLAVIVYTPREDQNPAGVMLSHKNIVDNIKAARSLIPINCDKKVFSLLTHSPLFERLIAYTSIAVGACVYYGSHERAFFEEVREAPSQYLIACPRLLIQLHDRLLERAGRLPLLRRRIVYWAVAVGRQLREDQPLSFWCWVRVRLADMFVYRQWRAILGGRLEGMLLGGPTLEPALGRIFSAAGIQVRQGYGPADTALLIAINRFGAGGVRFGTMGRPIPGVEVKIEAPDEAGRGALLIRGSNLLLGYFEAGRAPGFPASGDWLPVGATARILEGGFLEISDRKSAPLTTEAGKGRPE